MTTAELNRRLDNLIRYGVIEETDFTTDPVQPRVRVRTGEILTTWIPIATLRANTDSEHDPVQVGEHVILLSPSGETAQAVVIGKLHSEDFPSCDTSETNHRRRYRDGAVIEYDTKTHHLNATLPSGGTVNLVATGGISITGDITLKGNLHQTGNITLQGSQTASGTLHAGGTITSGSDIKASGDITAGGDISTGGSVSAGSVKASSDVSVGGLSLKSHRHGGVEPGGSSTGGPQ